MSARRVEFLYVDDCPSHPEALGLVRSVLAESGVEAELVIHEVRSDEEARTLAFPGSPTVRVDGRDVDPGGADGAPGLACRVYRLADGRVEPLPSRAQLEAALR
jgi:hypothetical protein